MMKKNFVIACALGMLLLTSCKNTNAPKLETQLDTLSWTMGQTIASGLIQGEAIEFDKELVLQAIRHTLDGKPQPMDDKTIDEVSHYISYLLATHEMQKNQAQQEKASVSEKDLFEKLVAENPNVKKAKAGFYYEVLKEGKGPKAAYAHRVTFDYKAFLMATGEMWDQTYGQRAPITTTIGNGIFVGLREGLQLMNAGATYRFYFPNELAFGGQTTDGLPAYSPMIYEVELHEILND